MKMPFRSTIKNSAAPCKPIPEINGAFPQQSPASGRALILAAAVLWSTSGFFAKAPWFNDWPAESRGLQIAFWRGLFGCLVLLPFVRRPSFQWPMIPMVVCFAVMVWSFMTAMVYGPAANAIWLQYLCPIWVLILAVLAFKEKVSRHDSGMFVCCLAGVLLILVCELRQGTGIYATILGILSGVMLAGVMLSMRVLRHVDPVWLIALNQFGSAVLMAPIAWQTHHPTSAGSYLALAFFGAFQMSIPYLLFARGLRGTSSPEASILALIEPILVPVWVFLAWHHHATYVAPPWWTYAGGSLITIGLLSRYVPAMRRSLRRRSASPVAVLAASNDQPASDRNG
jgi:drug/metabolite transporter (DMT)-like permease